METGKKYHDKALKWNLEDLNSSLDLANFLTL